MKRKVKLIIPGLENSVKNYFTVPIDNSLKKCSKCNIIKPLTDFYKAVTKSKRCKLCRLAYQKEYDKVRRSGSKANPGYYKANREKCLAAALAYAKKYPEKYRLNSANRYAKKLQRTPRWLNRKQLNEIAKIYTKASYLSKKYKFKYEVDHIVPLCGENVSGLHVPWNLRIISKSENCRKHNTY